MPIRSSGISSLACWSRSCREEQPLPKAGGPDLLHHAGHEGRIRQDGSFQFKLDGAALQPAAKSQRFGQRGQLFGGEVHPVPLGQVDVFQLTEGQVVDLGRNLGAEVDEVVVMDDKTLILGLLHIHLHAVGTEDDGVLEGGQGVFGGKVSCPTVRNDLRQGLHRPRR